MRTLRKVTASIKWKTIRFVNYLRYDVRRGLLNLLVYAPVIWRTREWDQGYLYKLMAFKLRRMERGFRNHQVAIGDVKRANEMRKVRVALERLIKDNYILKYEGQQIWAMQHADLDVVTDGINEHSLGWWN